MNGCCRTDLTTLNTKLSGTLGLGVASKRHAVRNNVVQHEG